MKTKFQITAVLSFLLSACASPPETDRASAKANCSQQCSGKLATCTAGFKMFTVAQQKRCTDTYDMCIRACPAEAALR